MGPKLVILLENNIFMQKYKTIGKAKCMLLKHSSPISQMGLFVSLKPFAPPVQSGQWEQTSKTGRALSPKGKV